MNPYAAEFVPSGMNPCAGVIRPNTSKEKNDDDIEIIPKGVTILDHRFDWSSYYNANRALTVIYNGITNNPDYSHLNGVTIIPFTDGSKRIYASILDHKSVRSKKVLGRVYCVSGFTVALSEDHTTCGKYKVVFRSFIESRKKARDGHIIIRNKITVENQYNNIYNVLDDIRLHVITPTSYMRQQEKIYVINLILVQSIYRGTIVRRKNNKKIHNRNMFVRAVYTIGIIRWWSSIKRTRPLIPECPICLADACPEGEREVIKTPCGHVFCKICIQSHVMNTIGNRGCPMCRCSLNRSDVLLEDNVDDSSDNESDLGIPQVSHVRDWIITVDTVSRSPRSNSREVLIQFRNNSDYRVCIHYIWNGRSSRECFGVGPGMTSRGVITYDNTIYVITILNDVRQTRRLAISTHDGYTQVINIH